jgi:hypothetical protein
MPVAVAAVVEIPEQLIYLPVEQAGEAPAAMAQTGRRLPELPIQEEEVVVVAIRNLVTTIGMEPMAVLEL